MEKIKVFFIREDVKIYNHGCVKNASSTDMYSFSYLIWLLNVGLAANEF